MYRPDDHYASAENEEVNWIPKIQSKNVIKITNGYQMFPFSTKASEMIKKKKLKQKLEFMIYIQSIFKYSNIQ